MIFTSGGTESINLAILGLASETSRHDSAHRRASTRPTREACRQLERRGWRLAFLDIDSEGRIVDERLDELPWADLKLATVILAHNETGVIQDVGPLAARCSRFGMPLHLDAVQAVGKMPRQFPRTRRDGPVAGRAQVPRSARESARCLLRERNALCSAAIRRPSGVGTPGRHRDRSHSPSAWPWHSSTGTVIASARTPSSVNCATGSRQVF